MGAFFLGLDRSGVAIDDALALRAMASLRGFAPFGFDTQRVEGGLLVVARDRQHAGFETIGADLLVLDGALSARCRSELQLALGAAPCSDAKLAHAAFERWGEHAARRLQGRFALVMVDRRREVVWLLRDPLGERSLHVRSAGAKLYICTRASALLAAANLPMAENPQSIAAYFALRAPASGEGYWQGVRAVQSGECLRVEERGTRGSMQRFDLSLRAHRFASDQEAVAAWQAVLQGACARALADSTRPAILLSGGIDSSALAATVAHTRPDLIACSWRLPDFPSADESAFVAATVAKLELSALSISDGQDWPLARLEQWLVEDETPHANPYQWLLRRLYFQAAGRGADVMLSGNFGDHLYADQLPYPIWRTTVGAYLRRFLQQTPGLMRTLRRTLMRYPALPDWLVDDWRRPMQLAHAEVTHPLLAAEAELDAELGRRQSAAYGIDLRFPYRDAEVIRFMAALPPQFSERGGIHKWITREALRDRLPERVRSRTKSGSLEPFFRHGILVQARNSVETLLGHRSARWPIYVKAERVWAALENPASESDLLLIWLAVSYELWWRAHAGLGPAMLASSTEAQTL